MFLWPNTKNYPKIIPVTSSYLDYLNIYRNSPKSAAVLFYYVIWIQRMQMKYEMAKSVNPNKTAPSGAV